MWLPRRNDIFASFELGIRRTFSLHVIYGDEATHDANFSFIVKTFMIFAGRSSQAKQTEELQMQHPLSLLTVQVAALRNGVSKGRRARHLPWAPLFGGPP